MQSANSPRRSSIGWTIDFKTGGVRCRIMKAAFAAAKDGLSGQLGQGWGVIVAAMILVPGFLALFAAITM